MEICRHSLTRAFVNFPLFFTYREAAECGKPLSAFIVSLFFSLFLSGNETIFSLSNTEITVQLQFISLVFFSITHFNPLCFPLLFFFPFGSFFNHSFNFFNSFYSFSYFKPQFSSLGLPPFCDFFSLFLLNSAGGVS